MPAKTATVSVRRSTGVTTYFCYNSADHLTASSSAAVTSAVYDTHGNTTSLGSTGNVTALTYDALDHDEAGRPTSSSACSKPSRCTVYSHN
jgi:hypothetical protein